jgi:hypothetical protein
LVGVTRVVEAIRVVEVIRVVEEAKVRDILTLVYRS